MARREHGRHAPAGDRAARAQIAGDQGARFPAQLHHPRPHHDLRQPERFDEGVRSAGYLVPGAQEHRRYPRDAAGGRGRARLQRRFRRHVRPDLRLHRRRLHPARVARLCRGYPVAPVAGSGRVEDRTSRRAGRADLCRVLDQGASWPWRRPDGADRGAESPERGQPRGRARDGRREDLAPRFRRVRIGAGPAQRQCPVERAPHPAARHRDRPARLRRSAPADVPRQRQAGHRPRHRDARRRRHSGAWPQREEGCQRKRRQSAARHRCVAGQRPAGRRPDGDRRVHGIALAGDRHHHGGEHHQPGAKAGLSGGADHSAHHRDRLSDHAGDAYRPSAHLARRADHFA